MFNTKRDMSSYQAPYLEDQADGFLGEDQGEIDMCFGGTHRFVVYINSSKQPLVGATGWCAQGEETLKQNLDKIQFEMTVNGQPVNLQQVYKSRLSGILRGNLQM